MYRAYHSDPGTDLKKPISLETDGLSAIVVVFVLQMLCQQINLLLNRLASFSAFGRASNLLFNRSLVRT